MDDLVVLLLHRCLNHLFRKEIECNLNQFETAFKLNILLHALCCLGENLNDVLIKSFPFLFILLGHRLVDSLVNLQSLERHLNEVFVRALLARPQGALHLGLDVVEPDHDILAAEVEDVTNPWQQAPLDQCL